MALPGNFRQRPNLENKMRGNDRILILKKKEGAKPKDSIGLVDPRLFEGKNRLHAIYNEQDQLWSLKYEMGAVPSAIDMRFTSFTSLFKHCKMYFNSRNIELIDDERSAS